MPALSSELPASPDLYLVTWSLQSPAADEFSCGRSKSLLFIFLLFPPKIIPFYD